jgi:2-methylcitrate dehydratase PrpD
MNDVSPTLALAEHICASGRADIPTDVWNESKRAVHNYLGCALGGSIEPALTVAIEVLGPFSGAATTNVLGRNERFDALHAALLNGIGSHVHEYDDTLPSNYIHPSVPVASALFAYAGANRVSGADFLHAFILGFEVEARIGDAIYPAHYEAGWHITSTTGVFGAAAAVGKLIGLNVRQMVWALGLAATQAAGIREMFGSMAKSYQPGRAAQNGYTAALLAQADFTAGERALEGPRGFVPVTAREYDLSKITSELGRDFALRRNAYKPYACGLVVHPTIDGCSQIKARDSISAADIAAVKLRVAPLVLDLCNQRVLQRELQSKYSIYHAAAIGLVRGKGGLQEFTMAAIQDPDISYVRERVVAEPDASVTEDQVAIEVILNNGETLSLFVEQSLGNVHRPLSNDQLDDKFRDQAILALPEDRVESLIEQCWNIEQAEDLDGMIQATAPDLSATVGLGVDPLGRATVGADSTTSPGTAQ